MNNKTYTKYIILTSISNAFLLIIKFMIGFLFKSIAIIGDAANNLFDLLNNLFGLFSLYISKKPADAEHPYGHARMEYICSFCMSVLILYTGLKLVKDSFVVIINNQPLIYTNIVLLVMIISFIIKFSLFIYYKKQQYTNQVIKIMGYDNLNDALSNIALLIAFLIANYMHLNLDGYLGIFIGGYIIFNGFRFIKLPLNNLLGTKPNYELKAQILNIVNNNPFVLETHDLQIHSYGANKTFATIHVSVNGDLNLYDIHENIDEIERSVKAALNIDLLIHIDPVKLKDPETMHIHHIIKEVIKNYQNIIDYHDLRVTHKNNQDYIYVDIVIKYNTNLDLNNFKQSILQQLNKKYIIAIAIDYA